MRHPANRATAPVVVVAAALKAEALHPWLLRGHLFCERVALALPNRTERMAILSVLTEAIHANGSADAVVPAAAADEATLAETAFATEGYTPLDLATLLQRTQHQAALQGASPGTTLTTAHWTAAQAGFTPSSLRGVKTASSATTWRDIGGMRGPPSAPVPARRANVVTATAHGHGGRGRLPTHPSTHTRTHIRNRCRPPTGLASTRAALLETLEVRGHPPPRPAGRFGS